MMVEPFAGDKIEENLHPIGRAFYGASTLLHAGFAFAGSRSGFVGASRRKAFARSGDVRRIHPLPPGHANSVQSGF